MVIDWSSITDCEGWWVLVAIKGDRILGRVNVDISPLDSHIIAECVSLEGVCALTTINRTTLQCCIALESIVNKSKNFGSIWSLQIYCCTHIGSITVLNSRALNRDLQSCRLSIELETGPFVVRVNAQVAEHSRVEVGGGRAGESRAYYWLGERKVLV